MLVNSPSLTRLSNQVVLWYIRIYIPNMLQSKTWTQRPHLLSQIEECLDETPITFLLGARQTGKTTLARLITSRYQPVHYFDLDRAPDRTALSTPGQTLSTLDGLVVLDEVQRLPELFSVLRPLVDRPENPARFLLLGSTSPTLVKGVSETLAGRVLFVSVPGFVLAETGVKNRDLLWVRGGFPRSYLAASDRASTRWREAFVDTFLERDIPQLGLNIPAETLRRFWTMLSHYHGQTWNGSELARALGTNEKTARRYLDILSGLIWYAFCRRGLKTSANASGKHPRCISEIRACCTLCSALGRWPNSGHTLSMGLLGRALRWNRC